MTPSAQALLATIATALWASPAAPAAIDFEREIEPLLAEHCLDCHGPDKQKASLRVDRRADLLRGGDGGFPAIIPGDHAKSHLIERATSTDPDERMPPKGEPLTAEEIILLKSWIDAGAEWPGQMDAVAEASSDHWSFQPVTRPAVPPGATHPVDAFLDARLKEAGLEPNGVADPRSLVRRAAITLTGLPPAPERVTAFLGDYQNDADQAYDELVDELLASPHFGERWAQHWLDVIRWAESNGSEANLYRKNAWLYRDYVVRAFNEDVPYDRFVREQIAGDSLGTGEATGFLVAGPHVPAATVGREPAAIRQARADRMDEIMQTVGASIMGVTIGCARCHHHKFDPITIQDYYAMSAVFQDVEFGSRSPEFGEDHPRRRRGREIWRDIAEARRALRPTGAWEEDWGAFRELHFAPVTTSAIRIRFKMKNVGLDEVELFADAGGSENLALATRGTRISGYPEKGIEGRNPIERVNDGEFGTMTWRARSEGGEKPWLRLDFPGPTPVARLRLSSNREYFYDTDYLEKKPNLPRYEFDLDILAEDGSWQPWTGTWAANTKHNEQHPERKGSLAAIRAAIATLAEEGPRPSFVGRFIEPVTTHVLQRGSPENPRDEVAPAGPEILGGGLGLTSASPGRERRAEFAEWISSPENPLASRVMVNRLWHHVFGAGIVPTTSDFGTAGAPPTHPELLDWLAAEFAGDGMAWSMKGMIRLLVTSEAFKRSSLPDAAALRADAGSTLLWRFPPRRVEAEVIRDAILQASGKLDPRLGGRSYRIHNEKATYAQWQVVDNHGPETWRRMLYQERMRRVDDQMFTAFDFPDCGQVRAKRPVSTTPLQALNLMNSEFVVGQSKFIAARAAEEGGLARAFELLLGRAPTAAEIEACEGVGLELVCRSLINSNEFAFLP